MLSESMGDEVRPAPEAACTRRPRRRDEPMGKVWASQLLFRNKALRDVWRWLGRLGVAEAERGDVRQDVFLGAHRSFHKYDPDRARPERWLNRITVHAAAHYRDRAVHRREQLDDDFAAVVDRSPGADDQLIAEERRLDLLELLGGLEDRLRAVLVAHDIDGVPMTEIAETLGIPVSTAYKWRARALAALRRAALERRLEE
ncbi:MAG: sigma-70 family RNA polymerase sigma factor [Polyangiaceae bacterium]|nr:sigma-70 family RNA polymerase sigma factor [Polyangiaceae bacterium]